ncbi:MAG: hypothetical protein ACRDHZ_23660 [Ktedonobacteraceae bacterium]
MPDNNRDRQSNEPHTSVDPSGYILLNMPNSQKPLFLDLLRGFEEFAKLKGYNISFSYDSSLTDKVAFRFTILEGGVSVSTDRVKSDLQDYVNRVQTGASFDDLPIIIPSDQHHTTLLILKNRLQFLQTSYSAQHNVLRLYQSVISDFSKFHLPQPSNLYITNGAPMSPANYLAINSSQVAQGEQIKMIGNSSTLVINIGNSFSERKEIVDKLDNVRHALWSEPEPNKEKAREVEKYLDKARGELADEPEPDPSRLSRYLETAKRLISTATFAKEAIDAFAELLKLVGLS